MDIWWSMFKGIKEGKVVSDPVLTKKKKLGTDTVVDCVKFIVEIENTRFACILLGRHTKWFAQNVTSGSVVELMYHLSPIRTKGCLATIIIDQFELLSSRVSITNTITGDAL